MSNVFDRAGNPRVKMNGDLEKGELSRTDPQLYYILRLCQLETDAVKGTDLMKKLSNLHDTDFSTWERLQEREVASLGELAIITYFIQGLSATIGMPSLSEMNELKMKIDLQDFVVPIDDLLEPEMASKALTRLDQFIIENAEQVERREQIQAAEVAPTQLLATEPEPREKLVAERKQKEKTRPSHSSIFEIVAPAEEGLPFEEERPAVIKVRASTAGVFSALFAKAEARGSVSWTAFLSAMTDMGFSVRPRTGSVYTFFPPESMGASRWFTVHRPHKSDIEGYYAILYAKRLQRVYGWNENTFEVAD
ncbi:hypothetical protein LTR84_005715 [Exophiala bonariae]|uniref:Uncharacterized protein n=1 Tax=Exophiala bonariae TaxID=1690606 RepID=A0AAV9N4D3_9EURO|nr:hypothetical protein LTR84_005715 [Exophiala bonariae]